VHEQVSRQQPGSKYAAAGRQRSALWLPTIQCYTGSHKMARFWAQSMPCHVAASYRRVIWCTASGRLEPQKQS
jgi:hypothetical protein